MEPPLVKNEGLGRIVSDQLFAEPDCFNQIRQDMLSRDVRIRVHVQS